MKRLDPKVYEAINRAMTKGFDRWSKKRYGISGKRLLAKVAAGEGGGTTQRPNISSAGARGPFQFIPSTRAAYKSKYGLDAWRTNTEAAKAAMIHLKGTGVAGYNPGMPTYTNYILKQKVDTAPLKTGRYGLGAGGGARASSRGTPPKLVPGKNETDWNSAILASLTAGATGRRRGSLLRDVMARVDTGVYTTKTDPKVIPGVPGRQKPAGGRSRDAGGGLVTDGGGYAGTQKVVQSATQGLPVSSTKRDRKLTSSGNISDHWKGNKNAYAHDLPAAGAAGDRIFRIVAKRLGLKNARPGTYQRYPVKINGNRYVVQLLWKVEGHYDHVHVGVKRI